MEIPNFSDKQSTDNNPALLSFKLMDCLKDNNLYSFLKNCGIQL